MKEGKQTVFRMREKTDMNFFVEKQVLDIGVKIIFAVVRDIDNHAVSYEWMTYRQSPAFQILTSIPAVMTRTK